MKYIILISALALLSCKKNTKQLYSEDAISLSPNISEIKQNYYKYPLNKNMYPNYFLYSPIEPNKRNKELGKTLIKSNNNHNYFYFFDYIKKNMNGEYSSYIFDNNRIVYKNYVKIFENKNIENQRSLEEIKKQFEKSKIGFRFLNKKENGYTFLIKNNSQKDSSFCYIEYSKELYQVNIYYNVKDTINSLTSQSLKPFVGNDLEN